MFSDVARYMEHDVSHVITGIIIPTPRQVIQENHRPMQPCYAGQDGKQTKRVKLASKYVDIYCKLKMIREFPGGPVVRNPSFHCQGPGFEELRSHKLSGAAKRRSNQTFLKEKGRLNLNFSQDRKSVV